MVETASTGSVIPPATTMLLRNQSGVLPKAKRAAKFSVVNGIGIGPSTVDAVVRASTSLGWKESETIQSVGTSQMNAGTASARQSQ